jgi:hypothetical protein
MSSLFDFVGAVLTPALTAAEVQRVRQQLAREQARQRAEDERPWESGVPDLAAPDRALSAREERDLRLLGLELSMKMLCQILIESGVIAQERLATRLGAVQAEVDKLREELALATCAACGARIPVESGVQRATGILCEPCHTGKRRAPSGGNESAVPRGYREAPQPAPDEQRTVQCVACSQSVPLRQSYHSARGVLCARCYDASGEGV